MIESDETTATSSIKTSPVGPLIALENEEALTISSTPKGQGRSASFFWKLHSSQLSREMQTKVPQGTDSRI